MAIYRFKVYVEDKEDVYREIEIKPAHTFEDFHNEIQKAFLFDNKFPASFFIADGYWRKGQEFVLKAEDAPEGSNKKLMKKSKLAGFIDDPHQRFIYQFDSEIPFTFLIELSKIAAEDVKASYPRISKTVGIAPKQYKKVIAPPVIDDEADEEEAEKEKTKDKIFHAQEEYDKEGPAPDDDNETAAELNADGGEEEEVELGEGHDEEADVEEAPDFDMDFGEEKEEQ